MMKRILFVLVMVLCLCCSTMASAQSHGSTIVPTFFIQKKDNTGWSFVFLALSSIVNEEITCTIRFFDHNGDDITNNLITAVGTGSYYTPSSPAAGTLPTFTIPANGSRMVHIATSAGTIIWGHAIIEWASENNQTGKALVGNVYVYKGVSGKSYGAGCIPINSGQPF